VTRVTRPPPDDWSAAAAASDRGRLAPWIASGAFVLIAAIFFLLASENIGLTHLVPVWWYKPPRYWAACETMGNWARDELPARCLAYWSGK
jgi:hypothetical protein